MKWITILLLILSFSLFAQSSTIDSQSVRIGLALSGGGALGFAHLGVLKVLEREGIPISYITGVSMGSLVGGMYAVGFTTAQIESIAVNANWNLLFGANPPFGTQYLPERQQKQRYIFQLRHQNLFPILPEGIIPLQNVELLLSRLLSNIEYNTGYNFDSIPIPYRAVAVDLVTGNKVILKNGRLMQAIRSSIAIPGVFSPKRIGGYQLVDGGLLQLLPVEPLSEFNPNFIIGSLTTKHTPETGIALIDIISRSMDLIAYEDLIKQKKNLDVLIEPNIDAFRHSDFAKARDLIATGEKATESALPQIRAKLAGRKVVSHRNIINQRPPSIIRSIKLEGLKISHEPTVRHELRMKTGNYLRFEQLIDNLTRLFNTGLFQNVDYRLEFIASDSVDVIIELQEQAYGFYSFGVRYDNFDKILVGLEVGQGNINGSGASVRGVIHLGNPNDFRLGITGTRIFNLAFGYGLDAYWSSIKHSYYVNRSWQAEYNIDHRGGIAEAGYVLGRNSFFTIGFKSYQALYQKPTLSFFDSIPEHQWIIGPIFRMEYNSYDDLHLPTRGLAYQLNCIYAIEKLKSTDDFLKIEFNSERYIPFSKHFLFRYSYEIGASWDKVATAEYFRTGGENLIGFKSDEFTTNNKAILRLGSDIKLFELLKRNDYPVFLRFIANIAGFQRLDNLIEDIKINRDLFWGVGIGIRTNTPIGPFQLMIGISDIGKPVDYRKRVNVILSVGREFRYTKD